MGAASSTRVPYESVRILPRQLNPTCEATDILADSSTHAAGTCTPSSTLRPGPTPRKRPVP